MYEPNKRRHAAFQSILNKAFIATFYNNLFSQAKELPTLKSGVLYYYHLIILFIKHMLLKYHFAIALTAKQLSVSPIISDKEFL